MSYPAYPYTPTHPTLNTEHPITPCLSHLFNHIGQVYEQMSNWDNLSQLMSMNNTNGLVNGQQICQGNVPYMPAYRINWNPYYSSGMKDYFESKGTRKGVRRKIRMIPNSLGGGVQAFYDERTVFYEKNEDKDQDQDDNCPPPDSDEKKKPKKKRKKKVKKSKTRSRSRSRSQNESKSSIIVKQEPKSSFQTPSESNSVEFDPDHLSSGPNSGVGSGSGGSSRGRRQSSALASFEVGEGLLGGSKNTTKKTKKQKKLSSSGSSILLEDEDHEEVSKLAEETSKDSLENIEESSSEIQENPRKCQTVGYVEFPTQKECHLYDKKDDGNDTDNDGTKSKMKWIDDPCRPKTRMCIPDHLKYRNKYRSELYNWCSDPCSPAVELPQESEKHRKIQYNYMSQMWECYKEVPLCYNSPKGMRVIRTDLDKYRRKCDQVILVQENGSKSKKPHEDSDGKRSKSRQGQRSNASRSNSRSNQSQSSTKSTSKKDQNKGSTSSKASKSRSRSNQESSKSKARKGRKDCHPSPRSKNSKNSKSVKNSKNDKNDKNDKKDKEVEDNEDENEEPDIVEDEYGSYDANDPRGTEARRQMKPRESTESMKKRRERELRARERCCREMRSYERFVIPKQIRSCTAINEAKARAIRRKKEQEKCRRAKTAHHHHCHHHDHDDDNDCDRKYSKYCYQNYYNYCCEVQTPLSPSDSVKSQTLDSVNSQNFEVNDEDQDGEGDEGLMGQDQGQDKSNLYVGDKNSSFDPDFDKSDLKNVKNSSVQTSSMEFGEGQGQSSIFDDDTTGSLFDQKSQSYSRNDSRRGSVQNSESKFAPKSSKYAKTSQNSGVNERKFSRKLSFDENESFLPMNKSRTRTRSSNQSTIGSRSRKGSVSASNSRIKLSDTDAAGRSKRNSFAQDWHDFSPPRTHSRPIENMNDMPPARGSQKPSKYSSKNKKNIKKSKSNPGGSKQGGNKGGKFSEKKNQGSSDEVLPKSNLIYADYYDYDVNQNLTNLEKRISNQNLSKYRSKPSKSKSKSPSVTSFLETLRKKPNLMVSKRNFSKILSCKSSSSTFNGGSASSSTIICTPSVANRSRSRSNSSILIKNHQGPTSSNILGPSIVKSSINKLDTGKYKELMSKKPSIIWVMGEPHKVGGQDRTNYCIQLCQILNFKYINMDQVLKKWSKIYQVGHNHDEDLGFGSTVEHDSFGQNSSFDSIDNRRLKRVKNNLMKLNKRRKLYEVANFLEENPSEVLSPDVINILIKCAVLEQFPADGYLIDSFPCSQEESGLFIKTLYHPTIVFYFLSNEWTKNKMFEPEVEKSTLFRRSGEYSERNVEKLCAQFTEVGIKVLNASNLTERKTLVLNNAVHALLNLKKSKARLQTAGVVTTTSVIKEEKSYKRALSKERHI